MGGKEKKPISSEIVNIVVSTSFNKQFSLESLTMKLEGAEYNPETFPGLILKVEEPKSSFLIFSSGNIICAGVRSMDEARKAIARLTKILSEAGYKVEEPTQIKVQNVVTSGTLGGKLNLNVLIMELDNTEYEPEQFPGLVYRPENSHVTFLLFGTGRVVVAGAKSKKEVDEALETLYDDLKARNQLIPP